MRLTLECAATGRDDDLIKAKNGFGNINIRLAPFYCADRDYWVAVHEIEQVRNCTMKLPTYLQWFDWQWTAMVIVAGFLLTNLLGLALGQCGSRAPEAGTRWLDRAQKVR